MKRRWIMLLSILVVLGVASTLAVAWACAAWVNIYSVEGSLTSVKVRERVWETTHIQNRFGHTRINFMRGSLYIDTETWTTWSDTDWDAPRVPGDHARHQQILTGWPWRAFRCERDAVEIRIPSKSINVGGIAGHTQRGISLTPQISQEWNALPYDPIWLGLIANTITYGAVWWIIIFGPFLLRKKIRRQRGLCPECAYDLRGDLLSGCPECGWGRMCVAVD